MRNYIDLINMKFGKLTVIKKIDNSINIKKGTFWLCKCDCDKETIVNGGDLKSGKTISCGCSRIDNLKDKKFNMLTVLYLDISNKSKRAKWFCQCDCGNIKSFFGSELKNGKVKSCGCLRKIKSAENGRNNKKYNTYDLTGEYGICYLDNEKEFYFDLEDYDKIKNYYWYLNNTGYIETSIEFNKHIRLHKLIFPIKHCIIDHENRNKFDNRKNNLRIANYSKNNMNHSKRKDNISGFSGVHYNNSRETWVVNINIDGKQKVIDCNSKEEAILLRLKLEKEYYGEFAPQRHLFEEYNI